MRPPLPAIVAGCLLLHGVFGCAGAERGAASLPFLRVMTYNIRHARGMDGTIDVARVGEVIRRAQADVVALQEVDRGIDRSGKIDIMTSLSDLTGMTYAFGKTMDFGGGQYGNGFLVRYPILEERNSVFQSVSAEPRGLLRLVLEVRGTEVVVANTHLESGSDSATRQSQLAELLAHLNITPALPVIVFGDFNDTPGSAVIRMMREFFDDGWTGHAPGYTYPSDQPAKRIDYVFVSRASPTGPSLRPRSAHVISSAASDHLPLVVDLDLAAD